MQCQYNFAVLRRISAERAGGYQPNRERGGLLSTITTIDQWRQAAANDQRLVVDCASCDAMLWNSNYSRISTTPSRWRWAPRCGGSRVPLTPRHGCALRCGLLLGGGYARHRLV